MTFFTLFPFPLLSTHNSWCTSLCFCCSRELFWYFLKTIFWRNFKSVRAYLWMLQGAHSDTFLTRGIDLNSNVCPKLWWLVRGSSQILPCSQERDELLRKWFILSTSLSDLLSHMLNCSLCIPVDFYENLVTPFLNQDSRWKETKQKAPKIIPKLGTPM